MKPIVIHSMCAILVIAVAASMSVGTAFAAHDGGSDVAPVPISATQPSSNRIVVVFSTTLTADFGGPFGTWTVNNDDTINATPGHPRSTNNISISIPSGTHVTSVEYDTEGSTLRAVTGNHNIASFSIPGTLPDPDNPGTTHELTFTDNNAPVYRAEPVEGESRQIRVIFSEPVNGGARSDTWDISGTSIASRAPAGDLGGATALVFTLHDDVPVPGSSNAIRYNNANATPIFDLATPPNEMQLRSATPVFAAPTTISTQNFSTNDSTFNLTGTAEPNASITLERGDGTIVPNVMASAGSGATWSLANVPIPQTQGDYVFVVVGTTGTVVLKSDPITVTFDNTPPVFVNPRFTTVNTLVYDVTEPIVLSSPVFAFPSGITETSAGVYSSGDDTYTFMLDGVTEGGPYVITHTSGIADAAGNDLGSIASSTYDMTAPSIASTVFGVDGDRIVITLSEALNIDSGTITGFTVLPQIGGSSVPSGVYAKTSNTITLTFTDSAAENTPYTVNHPTLTDPFGNSLPANTIAPTINYIIDNNAPPTFTAITVGDTLVQVMFNERVVGTTLSANWTVGGESVVLSTPEIQPDSTRTEFPINSIRILDLRFLDASTTMISPDATNIAVVYVPSPIGEIKDRNDNNLERVQVNASDGISPTLSGERFESNSSAILIQATEGLNTVNVTLTSSPTLDNIRVDATHRPFSQLRIEHDTNPVDGQTYNISITGLTDRATPPNAATGTTGLSITYTAPDLVPPTVTNAETTDLDTITITFSEPVSGDITNSFTTSRTSTTLTPSTNMLDSVSTIELDVDPRLDNTGETFRVLYTPTAMPISDGTNPLDLGPRNGVIDLEDGIAPTFEVTTRTATRLQVEFSEPVIGSTVFGDWQIDGTRNNPGDNIQGIIGSGTLSGATTLTLTSGFFSTNPNSFSGAMDYTGSFITDRGSNPLARNGVLNDGIIPVIQRVQFISSTHIRLNTSEPISETSVNDARSSFVFSPPLRVIRGDTVIGPNSSHIDLTVSPAHNHPIYDIMVPPLRDNNGNRSVLKSFNNVSTGDITPPQFSANAHTDYILIQFSEPVSGNVAVADWNHPSIDFDDVTDNNDNSISTISEVEELRLSLGTTRLSGDPRPLLAGLTYVAPNTNPIEDGDDFVLLSEVDIRRESIAPTLFNPAFTSATSMVVQTSEPVSISSSVFSITNSLNLIRTEFNTNRITLITAPATPGTAYQIVYPNLTDASGNILDSNVLPEFTFSGLDVTAPTFTAETASTTSITVTFDGGMDGTTTGLDWTVTSDAGTPISVRSVSPSMLFNDDTLTLLLGGVVGVAETPNVEYAPPSASAPLTDIATNDLATGSFAEAADGISPVLVSAVFTTLDQVRLTFSEDLDSLPNSGSFSFNNGLGTGGTELDTANNSIINIGTSADADPNNDYTVTINIRLADGADNPIVQGIAHPVLLRDFTVPVLTASITGINSMRIVSDRDIVSPPTSGFSTVPSLPIDRVNYNQFARQFVIVTGGDITPETSYELHYPELRGTLGGVVPAGNFGDTNVAYNDGDALSYTAPAPDANPPILDPRPTFEIYLRSIDSINTARFQVVFSEPVSGIRAGISPMSDPNTNADNFIRYNGLSGGFSSFTTFTYTPNNIRDAGNHGVAGRSNFADINAILPSLSDASIIDSNKIQILVNVELEPIPTGEFSISPSLGSVSATYDSSSDTIELTTGANIVPGIPYTITHPVLVNSDNQYATASGTLRFTAVGYDAVITSPTQIELTFTTAVSGRTSAGDWVVDGRSVVSVFPDQLRRSNTLILTLDDPADSGIVVNTGITPSVRYVDESNRLEDNNDNIVLSAPVIPIDQQIPILSGVFIDERTIHLLVSESIVGVDSSGFGIDGGLTVVEPSTYSRGNNIITLTLDSDAIDLETYDISHPALLDLVGNELVAGNLDVIYRTDIDPPTMTATTEDLDTIKIEFSENVFGNIGTFLFNGVAGTTATTMIPLASATDELLVTLNTALSSSGATPSFSYIPASSNPLGDESFNPIERVQDGIALDGIAPTFEIVTGIVQHNIAITGPANFVPRTSFIVTFSEPIYGVVDDDAWRANFNRPTDTGHVIVPADIRHNIPTVIANIESSSTLTFVPFANFQPDILPSLRYTGASLRDVADNIVRTQTTVTATDGIDPVLSNPRFTSKTVLTIDSNEPLASASTATFTLTTDSTATPPDAPLAITNMALGADSRSIIITTALAADDTAYVLTYTNVRDVALNDIDGSFDIPGADLTAPTYTATTGIFVSNGNTNIILTTNERVTLSEIASRGAFRVTNSDGLTLAGSGQALTQLSSPDRTSIRVPITEQSLISTGDMLTIEYIGVRNKITDAAGNELDGQPVMVSDGLGPEISNARFTSATKIVIRTSELTTADASMFTITPTLSITEVDPSSTRIVLTTSPAVIDQSYNIAFDPISDSSGNPSSDGTLVAVYVPDMTRPTILRVDTTTTSSITVTFSEGMDGSTVPADWTVAGNTNSIASVEPSILSDNNEVVLTLFDAFAINAKPNVAYAPSGSRLTDLSNNELEDGNRDAADGIASVLERAEFTGRNTLVVTFSEPLGRPLSTLTVDVVNPQLQSVLGLLSNTARLSADGLQITFNTSINVNPSVVYRFQLLLGIFDAEGNVAQGGAFPIIQGDFTGPQLSDAKFTSPNSILIRVNEPIVDPGIFIIDNGLTVERSIYSQEGRQFILITDLDATLNESYVISHPSLRDLNGNTRPPAALSSITYSTDPAPTVRAVITSLNTIDILFSELVTGNTGTFSGVTLVNSVTNAHQISATLDETIVRGQVPTITYTADATTPLADSAGNTVSTTNLDVTDTLPPIIENGMFTDQRTIVIPVSERILPPSNANVSIMPATSGLENVSFNTSRLELTITLSTDASPNALYTVTIASLTDIRRNIATSDSISTARAPGFTAGITGPTEVTIAFLDATSGTTRASDWQIDGRSAIRVSPPSLSAIDEIVLTASSVIDNSAVINVRYAPTSAGQLRDTDGEPLVAHTTTARDIASPTATAVFTTDRMITVTFSEVTLDPGNTGFVLSPSAGTIMVNRISDIVTELTLTDMAITRELGVDPLYMLTIPSISDTRGNTNQNTQTIPVTGSDDFDPPGLSSIQLRGTNLVTIEFDEAVRLTNPATPATIDLNPGTSSAVSVSRVGGTTITIRADEALSVGDSIVITTTGLADASFGNELTDMLTGNLVAGVDNIIATIIVIPTGTITASQIGIGSSTQSSLTVIPTTAISTANTILSTTNIALEANLTRVEIFGSTGFRINPDNIDPLEPNPVTSQLVVERTTTDQALAARGITEFTAGGMTSAETTSNERIVRMISSQRPLAFVEIGDSNHNLLLTEHAIITLERASQASSVFYIDAAGMVYEISECPEDVNRQTPPSIDECYFTEGSSIVIFTNHFTTFGVVGSSGGSSGGDGCDDCTPPTLGVDNTGVRRVSNGFTYNDDVVDVELYYTPLPLIEVSVGEENTAILKIFEDSGPTRIRHAGLAFGLSDGQHFAESQAEIRVDIPINGMPILGLDDPQNAIDRDSLRVETALGECMAGSTAECLHITIYHTFRAPLEFNIVSTIVWDERRNSWQNFYNHGIEVTGESLNPSYGIEVNDGALVLYPLITSNLDEDGDGIFDYNTRHVTYMVDENNTVYRLTYDGTYQPIRNLYSQLHDIGDQLRNRGVSSSTPDRDSEQFGLMMNHEADIARQMLVEKMGVKPTPEFVPSFTPSLYSGVDVANRMDKLQESVDTELKIAQELSEKLYPRIHR